MRIKIDPADRAFSLWIRSRDGWKCRRCRKQYQPPTTSLQCSHFQGRGKENTRFDPDNADALCMGCHQYFTANPGEHYQWQVAEKGQELVDEIILRSNFYCKKDRKGELIYWRAKLKQDFGVTF